MSLNDLCRALGFPGKPDDIDGSQVSQHVEAGRVHEVAAYCETDVVSTFRVWLVYELFRGALSMEGFLASEENLRQFLQERVGLKPHLRHLLGETGIAVHSVVPQENGIVVRGVGPSASRAGPVDAHMDSAEVLHGVE